MTTKYDPNWTEEQRLRYELERRKATIKTIQNITGCETIAAMAIRAELGMQPTLDLLRAIWPDLSESKAEVFYMSALRSIEREVAKTKEQIYEIELAIEDLKELEAYETSAVGVWSARERIEALEIQLKAITN